MLNFILLLDQAPQLSLIPVIVGACILTPLSFLAGFWYHRYTQFPENPMSGFY